MKLIFNTIFIFLLSGFCFGQKSVPCPANPDSIYTRTETLQKLADVLRKSILEADKENWHANFYVRNERGINFFTHDLTDTSNKQIISKDCVNFINNHIYHVAALWLPLSISHIVILEDGNLKVFKAVNCPGKGDKFEDIITYLNQKLKEDKSKNEIINRVKKYREYGTYITDDDENIRCEDILKN